MKHFFFTFIFGAFMIFSACKDDAPGSFYVSVQVSPDSAGSVIFNRGPHVEGTEITLTAVANDNYELFAWKHLKVEQPFELTDTNGCATTLRPEGVNPLETLRKRV